MDIFFPLVRDFPERMALEIHLAIFEIDFVKFEFFLMLSVLNVCLFHLRTFCLLKQSKNIFSNSYDQAHKLNSAYIEGRSLFSLWFLGISHHHVLRKPTKYKTTVSCYKREKFRQQYYKKSSLSFPLQISLALCLSVVAGDPFAVFVIVSFHHLKIRKIWNFS